MVRIQMDRGLAPATSPSGRGAEAALGSSSILDLYFCDLRVKDAAFLAAILDESCERWIGWIFFLLTYCPVKTHRGYCELRT